MRLTPSAKVNLLGFSCLVMAVAAWLALPSHFQPDPWWHWSLFFVGAIVSHLLWVRGRTDRLMAAPGIFVVVGVLSLLGAYLGPWARMALFSFTALAWMMVVTVDIIDVLGYDALENPNHRIGTASWRLRLFGVALVFIITADITGWF